MRISLRYALYSAAVAVLLTFVPTAASAASITCPNPQFPLKNGTPSNVYTVDPALDCVWGPLTSNNIGAVGDDFLGTAGDNGSGINDAAYGNNGSNFGLTWSFIDSTGGITAANLASVSGLSFTNFTTTFVNWSLNPTVLNLAYGTSYNTFALGIKDGNAPFWAVFLLDSSNLSGTASMVNGGFSHFVVYGANVPNVVATPEPGALLLLGTGLLAVARTVRKRTRRS